MCEKLNFQRLPPDKIERWKSYGSGRIPDQALRIETATMHSAALDSRTIEKNRGRRHPRARAAYITKPGDL